MATANNEEHKKEEKEEHYDEFNPKSFKEIIYHFADLTTAHGYAHLLSTRRFLIRVFWLLGIIICHVLIIWHANTCIVKYNSKPIATSITTSHEFNPNFPLVVICNANMIRQSKIPDILNEIKILNQANKDTKFSTNIRKKTINKMADFIGERVHDYGHQFSDMIEKCHLIDRKCEASDWQRYWHSRYGSCFTFNSAFYKNQTSRVASTVNGEGPHYSLKIKVNIQQEEYFANLTSGAGIRIYIGDQYEYYEPHSHGYSLAPGFHYSIGVWKKYLFKLDRFDNGTCTKDGDYEFFMHGEYFKTPYNKHICHKLCESDDVSKACGCVEYYYPKVNQTTRTCEDEDDACVKEAKKKFPVECHNKCQAPCKQTWFNTDITTLQYPIQVAQYKYNETIETMRNKILEFEIYFRTLEVEHWEEQMYYFVANLLSDIGGLLGLFSGYSVLTVIEFVVLGFIVLHFLTNKTARKIGQEIS